MIGRKENDQGLGPKGKMIEGRSGGSGRGTRRELWVPPDSGSAHRRIAGLYRVRRSTRSRSAPSPHSLPSSASSPDAPPAGHGEKFRRTQAHVQLGTRLPRMAGPKGKIGRASCRERGGELEENCGSQLKAVLLTDGSQVCIVYDARHEDVSRRTLISFPPPLPN